MQPTIGVYLNCLAHATAVASKLGINLLHMSVAFLVPGRVGRKRSFKNLQVGNFRKFAKVPLVAGVDVSSFRLKASKSMVSGSGHTNGGRLRNSSQSAVREGYVLPLLDGGYQCVQHAFDPRCWLVTPNVRHERQKTVPRFLSAR